ncbi:CG32712, partial [Drosophila busckii]
LCCFGALHMLNKIPHVDDDDEEQLQSQSLSCKPLFVLDLTSVQLLYIKWTLVLTIFYNFVVMLLIRAQYLTHFDINLVTSNAMLLIGAALCLAIFVDTGLLHERLPFVESWCNQFIVGFMYLIAIEVCISVVFFLIHSCQ